MKVKVDTSGIRESKWYQYVVRFVFGGAITALTGLVAKRFGPEIGGLFLAFPAILPATATLVEKTEKEKKERVGQDGTINGRRAAGVDAAGAAMGGLGLVVFGLIVWQRLPQSSVGITLSEATIAWLLTAVCVWWIRQNLWRRMAQKMNASHRRHTLPQTGSASIPRGSIRRFDK